MSEKLKQLQQKLNIYFRNKQLLKQAFTHASYVNEHRFSQNKDNERLEFLGDAVLELTVSEFLFHLCPMHSEGELTKMRAAIVCESSLVTFANQLQFGKYIQLGKGEELTGGRMRPALLADVFEAFIGALYIDQGLETARQFLQQHIFSQLTFTGKIQFNDYKTQLQELIQHRNLGKLEYRIIEERGLAHEREFVAEAWIGGQNFGQGIGRSKKEAEQRAAEQALKQFIAPK